MLALQTKGSTVAAALGSLSLIALVVVWTQREPIARSVIEQSLADNGVSGRYTITQIGTRHQRLENISIGDAANPDLTASWAEIDVGVGLSGLVVKAVRAGGVRLQGRLVDGQLTLGEVDRLLPKPTDAPFSLPDIDTVLTDARMSLATPWGKVGLVLSGKGNIARSFSGQLAVASPALQTGDVSVKRATSVVNLATVNRRILIEGALKSALVSASGLRISNIEATIKGGGDERGKAAYLDWQGAGVPLHLPAGAARNLLISGSARRDATTGVKGAGTIQIEGLRPTGPELRRLAAAIPTASGTPLQPVLAQLRAALARLQAGSVYKTGFTFQQSANGMNVEVVPGEARTKSGFKMVGSGRGFSLETDPSQTMFDARYRFAGGGFPSGAVEMNLKNKVWTGLANFSPYQAGTARVALAPVKFRLDRAGLSLNSFVTIDGPLGTGRLTGLKVPLMLRPGKAPVSGCLPTSFQRLEIAGLILSPAQFKTCVTSNDARIASPRLSGRLGSAPIAIAANSARIGLFKGDFGVDALAIRLGDASRLSLLDISKLTGTLSRGGANGQFSGAAGQIGSVPLLVSNGAGQWALNDGLFKMSGGVQIADAAPEPRFSPLVANDFALRLMDNRVTATAIAREPKSQIAVSNVSIAHNLDTGTGNAVLDVRGLNFGRALQPEALTNITLGVIANVEGSISGRGQIDWTADKVTSSGVFRTRNMNLAAAFGPVTGLSGEIRLSDLLALETVPGQSVTRVNQSGDRGTRR